jgi:cysteinyl-tRNA synthetase
MIDNKKMSKSLNNFYRVEDIKAKGYNPLSLRYLYLTARYRREMNFTWQSLDSAQTSLENLQNLMRSFKNATERAQLSEEKLEKVNELKKAFTHAIEDDLNMPEALSVVWQVVKSNIPSEDKYDLVLDFDNVLGLDLANSQKSLTEIPQEIVNLVDARIRAKEEKDFKKADGLREEIIKKGYIIQDNSDNTSTVSKK